MIGLPCYSNLIQVLYQQPIWGSCMASKPDRSHEPKCRHVTRTCNDNDTPRAKPLRRRRSGVIPFSSSLPSSLLSSLFSPLLSPLSSLLSPLSSLLSPLFSLLSPISSLLSPLLSPLLSLLYSLLSSLFSPLVSSIS